MSTPVDSPRVRVRAPTIGLLEMGYGLLVVGLSVVGYGVSR